MIAGMEASNDVMQEAASFVKFSEDGGGVVVEQDCHVSHFWGDRPDAQWPAFLRS